MQKLLKKHFFVGLSLAVAIGFVLAHIVNKICDYLYNNFIRGFVYDNGNPDVVIALTALVAFCAGVFFLVRWLRRGPSVLEGRWWPFPFFASALAAKLACAPTLAWLFPPENCVSVAGYDCREYAARLVANRAMVFYALLYLFFLLTFLSAAKLIRAAGERREKRRGLATR